MVSGYNCPFLCIGRLQSDIILKVCTHLLHWYWTAKLEWLFDSLRVPFFATYFLLYLLPSLKFQSIMFSFASLSHFPLLSSARDERVALYPLLSAICRKYPRPIHDQRENRTSETSTHSSTTLKSTAISLSKLGSALCIYSWSSCYNSARIKRNGNNSLWVAKPFRLLFLF